MAISAIVPISGEVTMGNIAPMTNFMGGKQPPDKVPVKPLKTGQSTVNTTPRKPPKKKRVSSPLAGYAGKG